MGAEVSYCTMFAQVGSIPQREVAQDHAGQRPDREAEICWILESLGRHPGAQSSLCDAGHPSVLDGKLPSQPRRRSALVGMRCPSPQRHSAPRLVTTPRPLGCPEAAQAIRITACRCDLGYIHGRWNLFHPDLTQSTTPPTKAPITAPATRPMNKPGIAPTTRNRAPTSVPMTAPIAAPTTTPPTTPTAPMSFN